MRNNNKEENGSGTANQVKMLLWSLPKYGGKAEQLFPSEKPGTKHINDCQPWAIWQGQVIIGTAPLPHSGSCKEPQSNSLHHLGRECLALFEIDKHTDIFELRGKCDRNSIRVMQPTSVINAIKMKEAPKERILRCPKQWNSYSWTPAMTQASSTLISL